MRWKESSYNHSGYGTEADIADAIQKRLQG